MHRFFRSAPKNVSTAQEKALNFVLTGIGVSGFAILNHYQMSKRQETKEPALPSKNKPFSP